MAFSSALSLADLNDYLAPSQVCIKSVEVTDASPEREEGSAATEIRIDGQGHYYEVASGQAEAGPSQPQAGKKLQKAQITLNDCLACSGCITSAESVLVSMQSHEEVYRTLTDRPDLAPVMSMSPQSLASLAVLHDLTPEEAMASLELFFRREWNFRALFDTTFARAVSLAEGQREWLERSSARDKGKQRADDMPMTTTPPPLLPLLASACPGWICYAEKTHGELLPYMSTVKSPQQIMGTLVKDWWGAQVGLSREQIYHVSVMPCYDKKLEASRPDFADADGVRDVDCVLTTGEVQKMLDERGASLADLAREATATPVPSPPLFPSLLGHPGTSSGSYLHNIVEGIVRSVPTAERASLDLDVKPIRGTDYVEYVLTQASTAGPAKILFKGATCYGFRNLQNVVRKVGREQGIAVARGAMGKAVPAARARGGVVRRGQRAGAVAASAPDRNAEVEAHAYDFIEVMACPSGCVNGGGQIPPSRAVDAEGMPKMDLGSEIKVVADLQSTSAAPVVIPAKEWLGRVERMYWSIGLSSTPVSCESLAHRPIGPFLGEPSRVDLLAGDVAASMLHDLAGSSADPEVDRRRLLRTSYRAVESEVNGLAVVW